MLKRMGLYRQSNLGLNSILFVSLIAITCSLSFASRREKKVEGWKPSSYQISITLGPGLQEIRRATTAITIETLVNTLSEVSLDFGDLPVDAVTVNKRTARFTRDGKSLLVHLLKPVNKGVRFVITVQYHGKPRDGLIMTNDKDGKPSAVGDNWPDRVHHWIPSLDHPSAKAPVSFVITAPSENVVVANGKLTGVKNGPAMTRTWSYTESAPIPPYCMILAAGQFAKLGSSEPSIVPLSYYVPRSDEMLANKGFAASAHALKYFNQTVAPYPYEKLALIVGATQFGGMENSSAIVFSAQLFSPSPASALSPTYGVRKGLVEVIAHEIAHQWFGDSVTESTWSDLWLSEGFATYFAGLFVERSDGQAAFREYMRAAADETLKFEQQKRIPLHDTETENLFQLLNPNNYQKGAWVLHMLRAELGDEVFFRGIKTYYDTHKGSTASSEDLRRALEKTSAQNLREFFDRWVYGTGHPQYLVSWHWDASKELLKVELKQTQAEPAFPNTLPIDVIMNSGKVRLKLTPLGKEGSFEFHLQQPPLALEIDPDNTVLKESIVTSASRDHL